MNNSTTNSLEHRLLYAFIELRAYTPDFDKWNASSLRSNPPRLIRLQRLQALFRALKINWNPSGFIKGEFINENLEMYKNFNRDIFEGLMSFTETSPTLSYEDLPWIFENLYKYRIKVEQALSIHNGLLCIGELLSYFAIEHLNTSIKLVIEPLDELLILLINPSVFICTEEQLVYNFGFPLDDLNQIDIDHT